MHVSVCGFIAIPHNAAPVGLRRQARCLSHQETVFHFFESEMASDPQMKHDILLPRVINQGGTDLQYPMKNRRLTPRKNRLGFAMVAD
jgi:hypothetical protein